MFGLFINTVHVVTLQRYLAFKFYKTTSLIFSFKLLYSNRYSHARRLSMSDGKGLLRSQQVILH